MEEWRRGRWQLMDAGIDGTRLGDPAAAQQLAEGAAVDLRSKARMRSQGTQFGGKHEAVTEPTVVERLLADAVAAEHQLALVSVPQRDGERSEESRAGKEGGRW